MSLPRIRLEVCERVSPGRWRIDDAQAHHLLRVRRRGDGSTLEGLDGGMVFSLSLEESSDGLFAILVDDRVVKRSGVNLTLLIGLLKSEQWNSVLRTSTELGVGEIMPIYCERSVPTIEESKLAEKMGRWRRVIDEASKIAGGAAPVLREPAALDRLDFDALPDSRYAAFLTPDATPIREAHPHGGAVFAIGPEGDWSAREIETLTAEKFIGTSLGPRILRASTAVTAVCAWFAFLEARNKDLID